MVRTVTGSDPYHMHKVEIMEYFTEPLYQTLSAPLQVQLELTPQCNQKCVHCYNFWRNGERVCPGEEAPDEQRFDALLQEIQTNGVLSVILTGGEPLLARDRLYRAMAYLTEHDIAFAVNSNLTLLSAADASIFRELGATTVVTSLLGPDAALHDDIAGMQGSFERTCMGVRLLQSEGVNVVPNMVVTKRNLQAVRATGEFAANDLGLTSFCATKANAPLSGIDFSGHALSQEEILGTLDDLNDLADAHGISVGVLECYPLCLLADRPEYDRFSVRNCRAGVTSCALTATGEMRPCPHSDMVYGNAVEDGLAEVWGRMEDWRTGQFIPPVCRTCARVKECSAGCRMEAKQRGDICGPDPAMTEPYQCPSTRSSRHPSPGVETRFWLDEAVRYRPESFGAIAVRRGSSTPFFVNPDGLRLLAYLSSLGNFTATEISVSKQIPVEPVLGFLSRLARADLCREEVAR